MRITVLRLAALAVAAGLLALSGCAQDGDERLVNELAFPLEGVTEVTIAYDEEAVTLREGEGDELVVREYMTADRDAYHARVSQGAGSIKVSEGGTPFPRGGFHRSVEVCVPRAYSGNLTVTTTDGPVSAEGLGALPGALRVESTAGAVSLGSLQAREVCLATTSGTITASSVGADAVAVTTTSGSFSCGQLVGVVDYVTTSGSINVQAAVGAGRYRAENSGAMDVTYTEVTGDLSLYNKNDGVRVTLPAALEFEFEAITRNGFVVTSFPECVGTEGEVTRGTVGAHPAVRVAVETRNGDIEVRR